MAYNKTSEERKWNYWKEQEEKKLRELGMEEEKIQKLRQMDPELSLHDLRIVPGDSHTNVLFDLVFPAGYTGDKDARLAEMCNFVKEQDPRYCCMVKVEQSYASALPEEDQ